ncbi:MAG: DUF3299 domain-containing protein [bacterium]
MAFSQRFESFSSYPSIKVSMNFSKKCLLILVLILSIGTNLQGFELKKLLFEGGIQFEEPAVEVSWRDLVQYDYKKKIIPPRLQAIEGRLIRVPGYVVPLLGDFGGDFETLDEFLLVPVYGMCIHVPPPPPNQVIYVKMNESVEVEKLFDAVWVTGQLQIDVSELPNTENLNYAPEGGFFLTGIEVEVYERDVSN